MKRRVFALAGWALVVPFVATSAAEKSAPTANSFYAMDTAFQRPGLSTAQQLDLVKDLGCAGIAWHEQAPAQATAAVLEAEAPGLTTFVDGVAVGSP